MSNRRLNSLIRLVEINITLLEVTNRSVSIESLDMASEAGRDSKELLLSLCACYLLVDQHYQRPDYRRRSDL